MQNPQERKLYNRGASGRRNTRERSGQEVYLKIFSAVFTLIPAVLLILFIILPDRTFSENENRNLQTLSGMSLNQFADGRFSEKFANYAADQFPFRDLWITVRTAADIASGQKEENGVFLGKDGYLIQTASLPDAENEAAQISAIQSLHDRYADIPQYFLLAPNAVSILKDKLPADAPTADQASEMDDFLKKVQGTGVTAIDVRQALEGKKEEYIYYRTDHHWTLEGAHLAFASAASSLGLDAGAFSWKDYTVSEDFCGSLASRSGVQPGKKDSISISMPAEDGTAASDYVVEYVEEKTKSTVFYDSDKLKTKDQYALFFGGNHAEIRIRTASADSRRLMILKDSYANCLIPYIAPYYREILVVDPRYCYEGVDMLIRAEGINEILYIYNANTLFEDRTLSGWLAEE